MDNQRVPRSGHLHKVSGYRGCHFYPKRGPGLAGAAHAGGLGLMAEYGVDVTTIKACGAVLRHYKSPSFWGL